MTSSSGHGPFAPSDAPQPDFDVPARKPRYTLRPVVKPLGGQATAAGKVPLGARAENEDDDGYDPYSDFHDGNAAAPSFEADPWR